MVSSRQILYFILINSFLPGKKNKATILADYRFIIFNRY